MARATLMIVILMKSDDFNGTGRFPNEQHSDEKFDDSQRWQSGSNDYQ
jgi:hypothetical protein